MGYTVEIPRRRRSPLVRFGVAPLAKLRFKSLHSLARKIWRKESVFHQSSNFPRVAEKKCERSSPTNFVKFFDSFVRHLFCLDSLKIAS